MMEWKEVKKEQPPLRKEILIAIKYFNAKGEIVFKYAIAWVTHPFSIHRKYNPNYFLVSFFNGEVKIERELKESDLWAEINDPKIDDNNG